MKERYFDYTAFRVSDLLERLQGIQKEGYKYCNVSMFDGDDELPPDISIDPVHDGGAQTPEDEPIEVAPDDEIIREAWIRDDFDPFYEDDHAEYAKEVEIRERLRDLHEWEKEQLRA